MRLHISVFTILIWLIALINGSYKPMCFLFSLLAVHELSHCIMAAFFHLPIESVNIYPFGLCAQMPVLRWQPLLIQLCVFMAGPSVHLIAPFILNALYNHHLISAAFLDWCLGINMQLLLFNCLPIYPLDGSGILFALLNCILPVKKSIVMLHTLSLVCILLVFGMIIDISASSVITALTLIVLNLQALKTRAAVFHDACLYRITVSEVYPLFVHKQDDFFLFRHNIYHKENRLIEETERLYEFLGKNQSH